MKMKDRVHLQDDDVLYFIHIPKTGGVSLFSLLKTHFPASMVCVIDLPTIGGYLTQSSTANFEQFSLFRAHIPVQFLSEIHQSLPPNPICVTILRDPVERTISTFNYELRNHPATDEEITSQVLQDAIQSNTLDIKYKNLQTMFLSGSQWIYPVPRRHQAPQLSLEVAKQRLEQMAFFGLTSRYAESVALLNYTFGWPSVDTVPFVNRSPQYSYRDTVSKKVQDAILEQVHLDLELLRFGEQLFNERYQKMQSATAQ